MRAGGPAGLAARLHEPPKGLFVGFRFCEGVPFSFPARIRAHAGWRTHAGVALPLPLLPTAQSSRCVSVNL